MKSFALEFGGTAGAIPGAEEGGLDRKLTVLSPREREVLSCIACGLQQDRVAESIGASVHTVDFHCRSIRRKLGASTMAEAVAKAYILGSYEHNLRPSVGRMSPRNPINNS